MWQCGGLTLLLSELCHININTVELTVETQVRNNTKTISTKINIAEPRLANFWFYPLSIFRSGLTLIC